MLSFLLIDEDAFNKFLTRALITHLKVNVEVESFRDPEEAFTQIELHTRNLQSETIILLDINLPRMGGWDFIDRFKKLPQSIRSMYHIYILSSYVDWRDKSKLTSDPSIEGFFQKPLEKELLDEVIASKIMVGEVS